MGSASSTFTTYPDRIESGKGPWQEGDVAKHVRAACSRYAAAQVSRHHCSSLEFWNAYWQCTSEAYSRKNPPAKIECVSNVADW